MNAFRTAAASLALGVATAASAADVTFTVPLDLSGFPAEVSDITVQCRLGQQYNTVVGSTVKLVNGAYKGNVTIAVDVSGVVTSEAPKITDYTCTLHSGAATLGNQSNLVVTLDGGIYSGFLKAPAKPGAVPKVTGPLKLVPKS